jgi:hypothetical protein
LILIPDGRVWVDRLGQGMSSVCMMAPATAESLIATVASTMRSTVTRENPILECERPLVAPLDGARFEPLIPPIVSSGPAFTIRRKASSVFKLNAYEDQGIMTARQCTAIERAVRARQNILVVGGPSAEQRNGCGWVAWLGLAWLGLARQGADVSIHAEQRGSKNLHVGSRRAIESETRQSTSFAMPLTGAILKTHWLHWKSRAKTLRVSFQSRRSGGHPRLPQPMLELLARGLVEIIADDKRGRGKLTARGVTTVREWLATKPPDFVVMFPKLYRAIGEEGANAATRVSR